MKKPGREMKPFFCIFGGKYRVAGRLYPAPANKVVIEPFAGAAGYSTRYPSHEVRLYDANPKICVLWDYLIGVKASEILKLPLYGNHVDEFKIPDGAKYLIGFWWNKASADPRNMPSSRVKDGTRPNSHWGEVIRARIATQVGEIKHWSIKQCSYDKIPNQAATWFIDPPYNNAAGKAYRYQVESYAELASFCKTRKGQVIVCEQDGADWLPFNSIGKIMSNKGPRGKATSAEAVWIK
jgi:site-specific DNA-adenine methylase